FEDGLRLVQKRGEAMQAASDATPSGMVSIIGMELPDVEKLCDELRGADVLQVANVLCPGNIVVSGTLGACERVADQSANKSFRAVPLAVAGAFHTSLMSPADETLKQVLAGTPICKPRIPILSNVDAEPHENPDEIREILVRQILSPVLWEKTIRNLLHKEIDTFYEVGPGRVLRGLIKRIDRKIPCHGVLD
ncbi:MAG: acyltransferase domain-containing protein, partial [Thermoguttaceae bacterium]